MASLDRVVRLGDLLQGRAARQRPTRSNLERVVYTLNGQKLLRFSIDSRGNDCFFEFDLGGMLITRRLPRWVEHDQWQLFDPSGHVLIVRGDKKYSYARSNQAHDAGPWKPVLLRGSRRRGDCLRSGLCSCDKGS